ncbi:MAG: MOSC domain-containing protein [Hyphomicrobiaceae bacterium]
MSGRLIGIARRAARRAPMEAVEQVPISLEAGLEGDHKGAKFPLRQVTVLSIESWRAALDDLPGKPDLPWTARRANLLVEAVRLPRAKGGLIAIGDVELEVTNQTVPCGRMNEAYDGLLKALHPDWRGGVTCRVVRAGTVQVGDSVEILFAPPEHRVTLPG